MSKPLAKLARRIPSKEQIQFERARRSVIYFISMFVWIEDKTQPTGISRFNLWPEQERVLGLLLVNAFTIILKARQLGLTWLVLAFVLWKLIFNRGYTAIAISKRDDPDAMELAKRMNLMLRYLPAWMIVEKKQAKGWTGLTWEATKHEVLIHRPDGESSRFLTLAASPDTAHSFTADLVMLDEWALHPWAEEIWTGAFPTMNRAGFSGQVIGLSTGRRTTLFEDIWNAAVKGANKFMTIFLSWRADPRRDDAWYEDTKKLLPSSYRQQYPATPEDAFSAGEGTSFPEFSRDIHVCTPFVIPQWWRRWIGHDPGYNNPYAWYWLAVSPDGIVYVYREYTREDDDPQVFYSDQGKRVRELSTYTDDSGKEQLERIDCIVAGLDAFAKSRETGKTYVDYYQEGGLPLGWGFVKANTDRELRATTWHEYLKPFPHPEYRDKQTAKVQIFSTCRRLIETLPQLQKDEKDPEKVADNPKIDNGFDGCGYALIYHHAKGSKAPPPVLEGDAKRIHDHIESLVKRKKTGFKRYG